MKRKYKILILCVVFILLSVTAVLKVFYGPEKYIPIDYSEMQLVEAYPKLKEAEKPAMIVFSYYTECCLASMTYYGVYNYYAKIIIEDYKNQVASIFIDYKALDSENRAVAMEIAQAYEITKLPTIVLLDGQGQLIEKFVGDLQEERVRSKLDEMANAN